jgi:hypothetical protein
VTTIDAVAVIIMRRFAFPLFVATSSEAGHGQRPRAQKIIPACVVLCARPDEPSILMEAHAASQSIASTAATHRAGKGGDNISASLILLALRRYRYETQRNNARLGFAAATSGRSLKSADLGADAEEPQNHQHNVRDEGGRI